MDGAGDTNGLTEEKVVTEEKGVKEETGIKEEKGVKEEKDPKFCSRIVQQIEYYFGDINLPRDQFLQKEIKLEDGWVPLQVLLKFKRLSDLTKDCDVIVSALKDSSLMEVSEDKKKLRRKPEHKLPIFNEERRKELMTRTVYCKGFPVEGTTLDKVLEFFNPFGPIDNVQMRSYKDKATNSYMFKGSVFVIFKTKDLAAKFLEQDIKYEDNKLVTKWQFNYVEDKRKERLERRMGSREKGEEQVQKDILPKGAILHLKGISGETTREDMKEKLIGEGLDVAFIDFTKGEDEAWVRLLGEDSAKKYAEEKKDSKLEICGAELAFRALEGDEETNFLEKTKEEMMRKRRHFNMSKRGRKGGRGGGRGGYLGKRKGGPTDGPRKKEAKSDTAAD